VGYSFAIAEADSDRAVGGIGLWLQALAAGRATAGYSVTPSARRRGIAAAALTALTSFAWTIPAVHRVELYIEPWNTGSIRTAERAGYQREGLLRSHQEIGGHRRDMLLYATVRDFIALCQTAAGRPWNLRFTARRTMRAVYRRGGDHGRVDAGRAAWHRAGAR